MLIVAMKRLRVFIAAAAAVAGALATI